MQTLRPSGGVLQGTEGFASVLTPGARVALGVFATLAPAGMLFVLLFGLVLAEDALPFPRLVASTTLLSLVPWGAARIGLRATRSRWHVSGDSLRIEAGRRVTSVPFAALDAVRAWRLPLPSPGLACIRRDGASIQIAISDPTRLLDALVSAGVSAGDAARSSGAVLDAEAKRRSRRRWWHRAFAKLGLFALPPGIVLFQLHQRIAYGAPLGQWLLEGPLPWLRTLAIYLLSTAIHLAMWAVLCRVIVEIVCFAATRLAPARTPRVRRVAEACGTAAFYGGVPLFLGLRLTA